MNLTVEEIKKELKDINLKIVASKRLLDYLNKISENKEFLEKSVNEYLNEEEIKELKSLINKTSFN